MENELTISVMSIREAFASVKRDTSSTESPIPKSPRKSKS